MVAFELARFFESAGQNGEAAKWYSTAAERFRRADWKTKAQESAVRLSGLPDGPPVVLPQDAPMSSPVVPVPEPAAPFAQNANTFEAIVAPAAEAAPTASAPSESSRSGPARRRGRRGGRNRRRGGSASRTAAVPAALEAPAFPAQQAPPPDDEGSEARFARVTESLSRPLAEAPAESAGPSLRGRYGDPGLSSRLSLLEMQFRRLLSCPPVKLDSADRGPAGPGVLLLSDSELTTNYYVEACQTVRIAIANLLRGGASRRGADSIKPQLADHLGIAESRVSKYLAEHCVVRYLQLDDGASHFAHFVIAVLRPALNE